ncbi:SDR family oxidoreductase [Butyrivibrio sp. AE3003]
MSPLKRLANPDDVIPAIDFFMSENCQYITGENLLISGGR